MEKFLSASPNKGNKRKERNNSDPTLSHQAKSSPFMKTTKTNRPDCEDSDESTRKKMRSERDNFDNFKTEVGDMLSSMFAAFNTKQNERMKSIEKQLSEVKNYTSPIVDIEKSLAHISGQLVDMQGKIDKLEVDKREMRTQIVALEDKLDGFDRLARKTSIEIRGVPKQQNERKDHLFSMTENLLTTLKIDYSLSDLRDVYRIPNKKNNSMPTLVAEFSSTLLKGHVLSGARKYNLSNSSSKLNSRHLGIDGPSTPMYISEHLSPKSRRLHYLAREFATSQGYAYCWPSNGLIFLRKREGSPHIVVRNETQLEEMRKRNA